MTGPLSRMPASPWLMLFAAALTTGCATPSAASAPPALRPLIEAMNQRLDIATDVARSKFYSGKPVQDTEREQQVIANAQGQATRYGLEKDDVRRFMTAQIDANKMVQYARLEHWHATQPPETPGESLTAGIRTRLDALQPVMMQKYAAFQTFRHDKACRDWVQVEIQRQTTDPIAVTALQRASDSLCLPADDR
ncbi:MULTISPECIES: chorismate mutase [unclassified Pseudomonas]|uniref:chorismate mutase n=1 Tax=unclassified Pseudomonas TaxID=196821 RepID=UPI000D344147|nr:MULTISPECIES: chorismate mutase [unclassified Pseudomonas]RAU46089.1 chorismate mutase [Pseudomonas sp. RIT 409]RAU53867.1 chorismate mutase [Pseudomonas sp. RIT 412]